MIKRVRDTVKFISSVKEYQEGRLKTEKQWNEKGYKLKNKNITGTIYCTSRQYSTGNIYYLDTEVKPMTPLQKKAYKNKIAKEKEYRREQKKQEQEKWGNAGTRSLMSGKEIKTADYIVLDTETTGLYPGEDEILQLSIIDIDGNILFNDYFQPEHRKRWDDAARVNGLYPADVLGYRHISKVLPDIQKIISNAKVIYGYNISFDLGFLLAAGIKFSEDTSCCDVMQEYAAGERWVKLTRATAEIGYDWKQHEEAHNALGDCFATLAVWDAIVAANDQNLFVIREEEEEKYERRKIY